MKSFCHTHNFYYNSNVCPWCEQDRLSALSKRYYKKPNIDKPLKNKDSVINESSTPSADMLQALTQKFNKH